MEKKNQYDDQELEKKHKEKRSELASDLPAYRYYGVKRKRKAMIEKATTAFTYYSAYCVISILAFAVALAIVNMYLYLGTFIPTVFSLMIFAVLLRVFYFKKIGRRVKFVRKLKRLCKKRILRLEDKAGFFGGMRFTSKGYHFTVQTPTVKYYVRYLTCFNYNTEVTFHSKKEIIIHKNLNAIKNKFKVLFGIIESHDTKEFIFDTVFEPLPKRTENIVLLNPVPKSIDYLDRDGIKTPTGSGEKLFGYTVYNGTDFLKLLERS
jgi:hypothetical protein